MTGETTPAIDEDGEHPHGSSRFDVEGDAVPDVDGELRLDAGTVEGQAEDLRIGLFHPFDTGDHANVEERGHAEYLEQALEPFLEVRYHAQNQASRPKPT